MQFGEMKILMGSANVPLSKAVCEFTGMEPTHVTLRRFPDKEVWVKIDEIKQSVRKKKLERILK